MPNSILLISSRPEDVEFVQEVSKTVGLPCVVSPNPKEAESLIREGARAIFVDSSTQEMYQGFENAIQNTVGIFSDIVNANAIHFITQSDLQDNTFLFESPIFGHFINRNYGDAKVAGTRYGNIVASTLKERAFDLRNLLASQAKIQSIKFVNTSQKQEGVEAVKNFLIALKFKSRMATVIANAVDELIMNAMFDAPVDQLGNHIYVQTPRDSQFALTGKSMVEMQVGYDGDYVAITAIDHFGSLDKKRLFNHISKRYVEEEYKIKKTYAGAGIGLATVFRSGGSFFFVSDRGVRTEVTVFFRRTDNFREFKDQFRFISTQFYL